MNRKDWLKLAILLGFVEIYFASFISVFSIIYAYFNLKDGFPHPYYIVLGVVAFSIAAVVFELILKLREELTIMKIKESEKNEEGRAIER
jgi:hypothetical protein